MPDLTQDEAKKIRMRAHIELADFLVEIHPHLKDSEDNVDWDKAVGGNFVAYTNGWAERAVMEASRA